MTDKTGSEALHGARERRMALGEALAGAESRAAAPAGAASWRDNLAEALALVGAALDDHVDEVEAGDGLLSELRAAEPRLIHAVDTIEAEHPPLVAAVASARNRVASSSAGVDEVRAEVLDVLAAISRHRQRGADLVYDAYNVDISGH
ncbi:MAG: hypothetical protein GY929_17560 [Actinomycetia bacterium]|nr:hypothetical protein [Actinomycetes bacterium]